MVPAARMARRRAGGYVAYPLGRILERPPRPGVEAARVGGNV